MIKKSTIKMRKIEKRLDLWSKKIYNYNVK